MRVFVACIASAFLVACATDDVSTTHQSVVTMNRLSTNLLSANKLAANLLSANLLSANLLSANKLSVNLTAAGDLLKTADGREVFSFIVSCALPADITLVADVEGVHYEFPGELALAPHWLRHRPTHRDLGWVSACLFARVNAHGVSLPVSLRGPTRALTVTPDERANWTLEEGAFYGNYFTRDNQPIDWIACRGKDQAAGETGDLVDRDCAEPDPADPTKTQCGFKYAGDCGTFAPEHACEVFSVNGTFYRNCHAGPIVSHHDRDGDDDDDDDDGHSFHQVITTFVLP